MADLLKAIHIGIPSVDHPFGIQLWPIFDVVFDKIVGFPAHDFNFVAGETPISTLKTSLSIITTYYIIIFSGRWFMTDKAPLKLNFLFQVHNLFLTLLSGSLLALFIEQLMPQLVRKGVFYAICDAEAWDQKMVTLYYLNYLTKYFELLDTIFLFVKKKPLTFLHCYHHGATALLCYTQLVGSTPVSWTPITINLLVHVVMYWYYFQAARGIRIWWKEWITRLQITQFVIDIGFIYFATYTYFTSTYWPWMPNAGKCAGEEFAAITGCVIISSYLFLFIGFYFATYKKSGKKVATRAVRNGSISMDPKFSDDLVASMTKGGNSAAAFGNGSPLGAIPSTPRSRGSSPGGPVTRSRKA